MILGERSVRRIVREISPGKPGAYAPGDFHWKISLSFGKKSQNELDIPKSHANIRTWKREEA